MKRWVLAATILGSSMAFIDTTVVNVALPVMQRELHASVSDAQWIIDAYLLVLSALILAGGSLGDRLGRVRVFGFGVIVFAAASIWCGAAPSTMQLIAARALQGAGAALLVPGSLAIITATFSKEERGRAIGTWSSSAAYRGSLRTNQAVTFEVLNGSAIFYGSAVENASGAMTLQLAQGLTD